MNLEAKLARRITVDWSDRSLGQAFAYLQTISDIRFHPLWADDRNAVGLDPEQPISINVKDETVLSVIEQVLDRADPGAGGGCTWQVSRSGQLQLGPRSRLNAFKRIEVYDVSDLAKDVPDHRAAPTIDLQQALQAGGGRGGSGGGNPISRTDAGNDWTLERPSRQERVEELATLIRDTVETDQWTDNGGSGATIRIHQSALIIDAPDYIHRAIRGPKPTSR